MKKSILYTFLRLFLNYDSSLAQIKAIFELSVWGNRLKNLLGCFCLHRKAYAVAILALPWLSFLHQFPVAPPV